MPVRAIPYYCNPAKIQSKTLSFTQTRPPRPSLHAASCHTKNQRRQKRRQSHGNRSNYLPASAPTTDTQTHTHTHAQLAGRCSLGLLCASKIVTKITERQAKKKAEGGTTEKK